MKFAYKFNNLLGTVYRKGNILFTPDGNSVISPVGNRITIYDLKNNKAKTLSLESKCNYTAIDLSPNGCVLLAINENGVAQMISMISCTVIHTYKFRKAVQFVKFSPNGKYFAVGHENIVTVFLSPGSLTGQYNAFIMRNRFQCANDDVTSLDWSFDSKLIVVGAKDNTARVFGIDFMSNFRIYALTGHTEPIVGCFFEANSLHVNTICRNGQLCLWECSMKSDDLVVDSGHPIRKKQKKNIEKKDESEDDVDEDKIVEQPDDARSKNAKAVVVDADVMKGNDRDEQGKQLKHNSLPQYSFSYKRLVRHYLGNEPQKEVRTAQLTSATYHRKSKLLITAFSTGAFYLYELPDVNLIHSLNITEYSIDATCFNQSGDWIALASQSLGQMLVWEWQSEQYIMKQQGHATEMTCISYSPDGQYIATGGEDARVKLWNVASGFCFVTFTDHTSCISAIQFSNNKKFIVTASYDGTVRAFDIIRYRNFRTLTTPQPVQFASVAIDLSGDLVAAGGQDVFEIFLWSMKVGRLLEVISGHEGPVVALAFSPVATSSTLVSGSWDKSIKIWNCLENSSEHETIDVMADVTAIAFKPNGEEISVATLNGHISIFNVRTTTQLGSIEGRNDLGSGLSEIDLITAKRNLEGKCFTSITYSADGECLLAAGKSVNVCIYHLKEKILLKKFEITQNQSLDGLNEFHNRRNMTDFGNMALIEEREELEGGQVKLRLPGVTKGDMAARSFKPEVNVFAVRFSPTGQSWAAATTEGLMIYSLDKGIVFDPYQLGVEITPKNTRRKLTEQEYAAALIMALKLNETALVHQVIEGIPFKEIELVVTTLPDDFAHRTLQFIGKIISSSPHIEFYLKWSNAILTSLGQKDNVLSHPTLIALQQALNRKYEMLSKICDYNKYTLRVMKGIAANEEKKASLMETESQNGHDDDDDDDLLIRRVENDDDDDVEMSSGEEDSD